MRHFSPRQDLRVLINVVESFFIESWVPEWLVTNKHIGSDHFGLSHIAEGESSRDHGLELLWLCVFLLLDRSLETIFPLTLDVFREIGSS